TVLPSYWHGDWNDSLQPADSSLRERLCSAWTVTLHHQTLSQLGRALARVGEPDPSLQRDADAVADAFRRDLLADGVVTGYALYAEGQPPQLWLHPRDRLTGLRYSLLPMMHAVLAELLTPEEAQAQLALIEERLLGPDGARLFDAPLPYQGGRTQRFQRAETSSFFGREIGVMYMHAHLRWAQTLAHLGRAQALQQALQQAHAIDLQQRLPQASLRQSNCYYSSSDAAFPDRYAAHHDYARLLAGEVALDGGWRVYSSGPGIFLALLVQQLLGVRLEHEALLLDPVMPAAWRGLHVELTLADCVLNLHFEPGPLGCGVQQVLDAAGCPLHFERRPNRYRLGAAALPRPPAGSRLQLHLHTA
ncbi:MAG: hypothetical protein JNM37_17310, partial [Rhodocyclaceae bacterium]|nr:hypothetical protein [Rhodocyclaceae bacterium]